MRCRVVCFQGMTILPHECSNYVLFRNGAWRREGSAKPCKLCWRILSLVILSGIMRKLRPYAPDNFLGFRVCQVQQIVLSLRPGSRLPGQSRLLEPANSAGRSETVERGLSQIALKRKSQSRTDFPHPPGTQLRNPPPQSILGNRNRIVQVDCAWPFHAVLFIQNHLGGHTADTGCDRCDRNRGQITDGAIASEHNHWSSFIWRSKVVQTDVAAGYSAGHAASASQTRDSSRAGRCLE